MSRLVNPEIEELVNQIGNFIQYWGFKNVQGRIWAHLFLTQESLDAADLMKRLSISKALVSISIKEMLEYEVIRPVGKSERGTTLYEANSDTHSVILNVLRGRERMMLSRISSAHRLCESLPDREKSKLKISEERMKRLGEMVRLAEVTLDGFLHSGPADEESFQDLKQELKGANH